MKFTNFPGEIKRVDGYTMTPDARTWKVSCEPERFRARGPDNFKNVDIHRIRGNLHLIHQRNVHHALNIFQKLREFGRPSGADRYHAFNHLVIKCEPHFETVLGG